jgi:hypothetical protein
MVKKKLILKESELVELINTTIKAVQEQNMVPTDMEGGSGPTLYYDSYGRIITNPSYLRLKQKEIDDAVGASIGKSMREDADLICDKFLTGKDLTDTELQQFEYGGYITDLVLDCLQENQPDLETGVDYHTVLMILAIVFYVISAIGTIFAWTGAGAIIAEAALIIATIIEFADGLGYILDDEPDYFMAGITWVFMIVYPLAQAGKSVFRPITKKVSKLLSQAAKLGFKGVHTSFNSLTRSEKVILRGIFDEYPKLKTGIHTAKNKLNHDIRVVKKAIRTLKGWPGTSWAVKQLEWVIKNILKPIKLGLKLILNIVAMLSVWDPQLASGGFEFLGKKTGWDTFDSLSSLFDTWAKSGIHGQGAYKVMLDWYGNPRAVITTTPKDCSLETYSWIDTKTAYKTEFDKLGLSDKDLIKGIWEEWQKGWRPGRTIENASDILSTEFALLQYEKYFKLISGHRNTLIKIGFTDEEVDSWMDVLGSCEKFLKAIETDNEILQEAMTYLEMFEEKLK